MEKTTDYSIFKVLKGNREINAGHTAKLTASIFKSNLLHANPIIVNEKMEVIDGQHRLEVAKANSLPIYYVVVPSANIENVMSINSALSPWSTKTYLESYAARGVDSYVWIADFIKTYGISLSIAILLVYGSHNSRNLSVIRNGKLNISDGQRQIAEERGDILSEVENFIYRRGGRLPEGFVSALVDLCDNGDGKRLVQSLQKKGKQFNPATRVKEAQDQLQSLMA